MDYKKIKEKQELYIKNKDKISQIALLKYETAFDIEYTHNSTAIECNTLTLIETKLLIDDNISIGGKALREIYEVVNHKKAFDYVKKCVSENSLNEKITKDIHAIINENIFIGGIYRMNLYISGAKHKPPVGMKMYEQIKISLDLILQNLKPYRIISLDHANLLKYTPL